MRRVRPGKFLLAILMVLAVVSCSRRGGQGDVSSTDPLFFKILDNPLRVVSVSPADGKSDTLLVDRPMGKMVCMSSSHIGYLEALGSEDAVCAVSGVGYITNPSIRSRYDSTLKDTAVNPLYDVGYESALDYERILSLSPDLFITYSVGGSVPPYISKLRSLGVRVFVIYENMEEHPLARSGYVKLFGALVGKREKADSLFEGVRSRYEDIRSKVSEKGGEPKKVLMNIPYAGEWFIPGGNGYASRLVRDAGGEVLGAGKDRSESSVVSLEKALLLSRDADIWLNPGGCRTKGELLSLNPLFSSFDIPKIYNNIKRSTPQGGNDFWESGAFRADLALKDLAGIFQGDDSSLYYYIKVE